MDRRTYWCHQCDMSISLIPTTLTTTTTTTNTTSCPHCTSDVLAELDSPFTFDTQNNNLNNNQNDTSLIFDSPYFHHVISHLFNNSFDQSSYGHDDNNDDHLTSDAASEQNKVLALSKGDINGIKSVKITSELLGNDPVVICVVCKELFEIDDDVKELPCKHMYHPGCIIPWLLMRNSCPLCRFEMPVQEEEEGRELKFRRRRSSSSVLRGEDFMDDDEEYDGEEELFGFGLRHLARRHRLIFPMTRNDQLQQRQVEEEILFTLGRIGEEEVEVGDSARTGNVETGSSWPNWPVVDGAEIAMGSASVNDDVDVVIS